MTAIEGQRHDRTALILYGSETGNSEDAAQELGRIAERLHFETRVREMDRVEINELKDYTLVVFAISTTGQGVFPRNARKFWKSLLKKRLPADYLSHVPYTTFGFGDSSYPKFNWSARKLHKRLGQLGAKEFYPRGEADEKHPDGNDGTFLSWSVDIGKHILTQFPLPEGQSSIPLDVPLLPKFHLDFAEPQTGRVTQSLTTFPEIAFLPIPGHTLKATLVSNERTTPATHFQDARHLIFQCDAQERPYPGDTWTIYPQNFPSDVDALINLMNWQDVADEPLCLVHSKGLRWPSTPDNLFFVPRSSLRQLLTNNLNIHAIPRRDFFLALSEYTSDEQHRERLKEFADPKYTEEYYDYVTRPRRSIFEVLQDFSSIKLPWKYACSFFPLILGRDFSIASGGAKRQQGFSEPVPDGCIRVEFLIAIVEYKTILKKVRKGLCTRYLAAMPTGSTIQVVAKSNSKTFWEPLSKEPETPAIIIAPGTGVAPCRSLIWERIEQAQNNVNLVNAPQLAGPMVLFYGSRNADADYYFCNEWRDEKVRRLGLQVHTAFSRDQREKIYVQDTIRAQGELVYDCILRKHALVYICGKAGDMPKRVREALAQVLFEGMKADWGKDVGLVRTWVKTLGCGELPGRDLVGILGVGDEREVEVDRMLKNTVEKFFGMMETKGRWNEEVW